ncbi:quinolinate synthase, chloroplastic [Juglans microcarpa x Juglans regia]|uniref:quinolinate synthase, chloroplastic n=1 Tax=Juglans microcarpa x Juglans regia TaxID=2249226 RepID=UPI001B7D9AF8|nr:quinolinate synthase, chloroplastic [Juglans microcarpa x Juglans regia]
MDSSSTMALRSSSSSFSSASSFSVSHCPNPKPGYVSVPFNFNLRNPQSSFMFCKSLKCIQSSTPDSNPMKPIHPKNASSPFACSAVTFSPSQTADLVSSKLHRLISEFQSLSEPVDRVKRLLHYATLLPPLDESARKDSNRVMGCTAQVWLQAQLDQYGKMKFAAESDSEITKGFCSCLVWVLDGAAPEEVLKVKTEDLADLNVGVPARERSRVNTWHNVLVTMQKRTKALVAEREGKKPPFEPFPSLVVTADGIEAKGSYAEAQAKYLLPDEFKVKELVDVLKAKNIGVVAHFYMDPEVQGVLTAAQKQWPHIYISDSLVMADAALKMAKTGCQFITVLGVDFMSENVRAILDQAGFGDVGVFRMSNERISCSLADAAASPSYMNYLEAASMSPPSLHVIYINTSLDTKAYAHELVPTITCTSSNVVQTILQAFAQVPDLNIWYGPDSYMGANIKELFQQMSKMTDEEITEIHPGHSRETIRSLLPHLHYYQDGTCIVHHLFGHEVVEKINEMYCDAFLTAHLEVPGEMFSLAMEAKRRGMGIVGSTQNILDFINQRVQEALDRNVDDHLQFVLGTESGMVTAIVAAVRDLLGSRIAPSGLAKIKVEIVFPVSSDSMTRTSSQSSVKLGDVILPVIPGVAGGEGCSIHGGCASCPYMKMNSLSSLLEVCYQLPDEKNVLIAYEAQRFKLQTPNGKSVADVGCEPILHMRHFQATKQLPEKLVYQIRHANGNGSSMSLS